MIGALFPDSAGGACEFWLMRPTALRCPVAALFCARENGLSPSVNRAIVFRLESCVCSHSIKGAQSAVCYGNLHNESGPSLQKFREIPSISTLNPNFRKRKAE